MKAKKILLIIAAILFILLFTGLIIWWCRDYQGSQEPEEIQLRREQEANDAWKQLLTVALTEKNNYQFIVVIDPLHGGEEDGISTNYGVEKDIVLEVARLIKEQNANSEIGIFLTREKDTNPKRDMRRDLVNQLGADLYLNLQVNESSKSSTFGTQVTYQTRYYDDKLTNSVFADMLEKSIVSRIEGNALGILEDTELQDESLSNLTIPAVTISLGYLTNPTEGTLLSRENYQSNLASGILDGIEQAIQTIGEQKIDTE